jgi:hypothetical protein
MKRSKTATNVGRSGIFDGQERWAAGTFHAAYDQRSETFAKSLHVSELKDQLYIFLLTKLKRSDTVRLRSQ